MKLINLNKKQLDDFVANQEHSQFLQSSAWADFNDKLGAKVWRLGVEENGELVATTIFIKKSLPLGWAYFYSPRGPIVNGKVEVFNFLMSEIKKIAVKEKVIFCRLEPTFDFMDFTSLHLESTLPIQPKQTIILNLEKNEEELLGAMHPKTRYNIKLASKKKLTVKHGKPTDEEFAKFWQLMEATKTRDNFSLHGQTYYRTMLASPLMELWQVYFEDQLLAVAIIAKFGDTTTYVHGASSNDLRPLMAPYWLHWQAIKEAKQEGFKYYDLFGVDKAKWPGVTRFKEGWGGANIAYPGTFDLVFNSVYYVIYQWFRRLRRLV